MALCYARQFPEEPSGAGMTGFAAAELPWKAAAAALYDADEAELQSL